MIIALFPGENRIEVRAGNEDDSEQSAPQTLVLTYAPPKPVAVAPRLHVLAVGVSRYRVDGISLKYPAGDALAIAELFRARSPAVFGRGHVTVAPVLTDEKATKAAILDALRGLVATTRPEDTVVLYLAGHGVVSPDRDGRDAYYFCPHDVDPADGPGLTISAISTDELARALCESPSGRTASRRVLILDTCGAGQVLADLPAKLIGILDASARDRGQMMIAASSARGKADESEKLRHGILTYTLLAALGAVPRAPEILPATIENAPGDLIDARIWFHFASDWARDVGEKVRVDEPPSVQVSSPVPQINLFRIDRPGGR